MNLVEAAKTRKPFRRKTDVHVYGEYFWVDFLEGSDTIALGYKDLIADDWEVKEEKNEEN